jgi:hypothetical protein
MSFQNNKIGIQSATVHLEDNVYVEFTNNKEIFYNPYRSDERFGAAKQINIISNKQMSFNSNKPISSLINADTIDISNSNLLFYNNMSDASDGTLLSAYNDIIFDGG